ncbi:unnamed protein product [Chrysoparadoxa australica]
MLNKGVSTVVVTLGDSGTCAWRRGHSYMQSAKKVAVKDTTGCGDAFAAGFLTTYQACGDAREALAWGCALGAGNATKPGGSTALSAAEMAAAYIKPGCAQELLAAAC